MKSLVWLQFMDPYAEEHDAKVLSFGEASKKAASIAHTAELWSLIDCHQWCVLGCRHHGGESNGFDKFTCDLFASLLDGPR